MHLHLGRPQQCSKPEHHRSAARRQPIVGKKQPSQPDRLAVSLGSSTLAVPTAISCSIGERNIPIGDDLYKLDATISTEDDSIVYM